MFCFNLCCSCVNDTFEKLILDDCTNSGLTKTLDVAAVYSIALNPSGNPANSPLFENDEVLEGYVISSDEGGNFYQSIYIQPTDGTKGFTLSAQTNNIYNRIPPGTKVYLKIKGLSYANPKNFANGLIFGAKPTDQYAVDRLPRLDINQHLIAACDAVNEDNIVHKLKLNQVSETYLNTLVEFDDVQFTGESASETFDLNRLDEFDSSTYITQTGTDELAVRTSRYANFAGYKMSENRGKIRGVLTKYNSTFQIILRTERDVHMSNPRKEYHPPILGNKLEHQATFNENFENYPVTSTGTQFVNYINDAHKGRRYWDVKSFNGKYIQMSSYASGGSNTAILAIPVIFTPEKKLSFKTKDGFYNGPVLKVYYSKDYTPESDYSKTTRIDITSKFKISSGTTTGYASGFTSSGFYTIPANLIGNGFIIFEYSNAGRPEVTTTLQIDDISLN